MSCIDIRTQYEWLTEEEGSVEDGSDLFHIILRCFRGTVERAEDEGVGRMYNFYKYDLCRGGEEDG
jgi:hypothetical protein